MLVTKKYKYIRVVRIIVGLSVFGIASSYIMLRGTLTDEHAGIGIISSAGNVLAKLQLIPSILSGISGSVEAFVGGVAVLLSALIFGRIYCSTLCPLGILQDIAYFFGRPFRRKRSPGMKKGRLVWYLAVALSVVAIGAGYLSLVGFLDPWSLFGKMTAYGIKPITVIVYNAVGHLRVNGQYIYPSIPNITYYPGTTLIAGIALGGLIIVSAIKGRVWCNYLCPVGAALGLMAKFSVYKISFNENCVSCGGCAPSCRGGCLDYAEKKVDNDRCVVCFDCVVACDENAIVYGRKKSTDMAGDRDGRGKATRKDVVRLGIFSLSAMIPFAMKPRMVFADDFYSPTRFPVPPGAGDIHRFMDRCTGCGLCLSKCPTGAMRASLLERGIGGLMQPVLDYGKGYCEYDCTICSQVCPTGALRKVPSAKKKKLSIGNAHFIRPRCIVYTNNTACGACAEVCPTHAVYMVPYRNHLTIPETDNTICIGCGACEFQCPVRPARAIYVMGRSEHTMIAEKNKRLIPEKKGKETPTDDGFPF